MEKKELYMLILGATPPGRLTEQHDVFFGIGTSLHSLVDAIVASWPEAKGKIHIDSWRKITAVNNYRISVAEKEKGAGEEQLFFLNLGGYKPGDMEEYHHKILWVDKHISAAVKSARSTSFYRQAGFKGAESHIDDKYQLDIDDVFLVKDVLPANDRKYSIIIEFSASPLQEDELHIGYLRLDKLAGTLL